MQQPSYVTPTELADAINELKGFMTSKLATKDEVRQLHTEVGELRTEVGELRKTVVTGFLEIKKHMEEWPNTPHPRNQ